MVLVVKTTLRDPSACNYLYAHKTQRPSLGPQIYESCLLRTDLCVLDCIC
uniref:BMA-HIS-38 n=1 Tax=Brugia malayi TaxID=6279 RepID=A0A0H5S4L3_BRUMA|nr:BMA-HIS-38 [Brugia malayi]